jgi:hypothetical protein
MESTNIQRLLLAESAWTVTGGTAELEPHTLETALRCELPAGTHQDTVRACDGVVEHSRRVAQLEWFGRLHVEFTRTMAWQVGMREVAHQQCRECANVFHAVDDGLCPLVVITTRCAYSC